MSIIYRTLGFQVREEDLPLSSKEVVPEQQRKTHNTYTLLMICHLCVLTNSQAALKQPGKKGCTSKKFSPQRPARAAQRPEHIMATTPIFAQGITDAHSCVLSMTFLIKEKALTLLNAFSCQYPNINFLNVLLQG